MCAHLCFFVTRHTFSLELILQAREGIHKVPREQAALWRARLGTRIHFHFLGPFLDLLFINHPHWFIDLGLDLEAYGGRKDPKMAL